MPSCCGDLIIKSYYTSYFNSQNVLNNYLKFLYCFALYALSIIIEKHIVCYMLVFSVITFCLKGFVPQVIDEDKKVQDICALTQSALLLN